MRILLVGHDEAIGADAATAVADLGLDWTLTHAFDASEALLHLQRHDHDAVVTELHPLGMEGLSLLERVRLRWPHALRLLLLDDHDGAQAASALVVAHRLLHRPLRATELIEAIHSLTELHELLDAPSLKAVIGRIDKLPPPPQLFFRLARALAEPDLPPTRLADILSADPVTAAKVLRLCNSAYYSGGRPITDLRAAVIRVGQEELQRMVLSAEVFRSDDPASAARERLGLRALVAAQLAAAMVGEASREMAATAALLAEVGMLLPGVRGDGDAATDGSAGDAPADAPHYAEAGAYLLGLWGLPTAIVEAVAFHHRPRALRTRGFWLGGAVHVARALAAEQPVDLQYLAQVGVIDELPQWRALAARLRAAAAVPSVQAQAPVLARRSRQRVHEVDAGGVHYTLYARRARATADAEAIETLLASQRFDAVAIACGSEATAAGTTPWMPRRRDVLAAMTDSARWAALLLELLQLRLARQFGIDPLLDVAEAIEGARQRRLPLWMIGDPPAAVVARAMPGLPARLLALPRVLAQLRRPMPPLSTAALSALADGEPVASALREAGVSEARIRRSCYGIREQVMAAQLRQQVERARVSSVLVLLAAGHLDGLLTALRQMASAPPRPAAAAARH